MLRINWKAFLFYPVSIWLTISSTSVFQFTGQEFSLKLYLLL